MSLLSKQEIVDALARLGELAAAQHVRLELSLFGGAVMVLVFGTRQATKDVDVVILSPSDLSRVRAMASTVAIERNLPPDWLNDAVKGFVVGISAGSILLSSPGIEVRCPSFEQLLAMKLCAWRDDVDIADARRLLKELQGDYNQIWSIVVQYLQPGCELKAKYAFDDLWEEIHGKPD